MQTYKCINGDFSAPAFYGNELLLPVQSLNTPQYLLIKGKVMLEDDYTFAAGSDIIFLDNNSGFRVLNGKKLTLQGIDLHGCTKLWAGVEVLAGASISADDCTFEDAKAAIVLRNQSIVEATGNTFRKNVCGILGLSTNPGISSSSIFLGSAKGISGNTFWGNDQLLEPSIPNMIDIGINSNAPVSATNYPYTGIWIERINALTIGNVSTRWYGTNSPIEAFALNSASAQASVFNINSSNLNSIFWPLPRKIGALDDNFTWFVPSTIGQEANDDEVACYLTVPGPRGESSLANSDLQLLEGTYAPPLPYPALAWEAKWEFADRLHRNPDLQTTNSVVEQYYADHFDSTYSCLNRAYQRYLNRWQPNDPLYGVVQSYTDSLQNALAARYVLDSLLSVEWDENAHVHAQMLGADSMIEYLTTELEEAINNLNALVGQQVNTLIAEVNNISCTAAYETDMKEVVKTMLISHFTDGVLTNEQTTRIKAIADKCRYSGGYAVLLARGFFEPQETYSQDADCDAAPKISSVVQPVSGGVHIYPNPAKQAIAVELESKVQGGVLRVYNAQGLQVLQITLADQRTVLPVHTLPNGVYFLEVQMDNQPVIRKSIVVNH